MLNNFRGTWWVAIVTACLLAGRQVFAQPPEPAEAAAMRSKLTELEREVTRLKQDASADDLLPDVAVYAKGADWILRHNEFYKPEYAEHTRQALETGLARAGELTRGTAHWDQKPGKMILAYQSAVDQSIQPYALTLPAKFRKDEERRWPLHVVLHGRGATLNEISFIRQHDAQPAQVDTDWIQLDVFGRTNNAYRWAGETDVFEALADVKRRYRIDDLRIVLHGFSMGGAGSWHLGLHHPSRWCSVGPGAGFVDFYKYQKVETPLPFYQDLALSIYNPMDSVLNAFNVPICTYGGELDEQLVASTDMVAAAGKLGLEVKLLIGPGVGHAFHPETKREFMAFHRERQQAGRQTFPGAGKIRFVSRSLKYNTCEWLTIEEIGQPYRPAIVEGGIDDDTGLLKLKTQNVAIMQIARDVAEEIEIDGSRLPLATAAGNLLPGVFFESARRGWNIMGYEASLDFPKNLDIHKRHNLQGPIDDAFMQPFVCVRGTGVPWNQAHQAWADWTLDRFSQEFDKWFRGKVPMIDDSDVSPELGGEKNLILFGDPGSNSVLAKIVNRLPIAWKSESFTVNGEKYDPASHGVSLIYPNPMHSRRYVVVNSGHTFHAEDFQKSNAWLFPRLGDIAVQKFERLEAGGYRETVVWADFFNSVWKLPSGLAPKVAEK